MITSKLIKEIASLMGRRLTAEQIAIVKQAAEWSNDGASSDWIAIDIENAILKLA